MQDDIRTAAYVGFFGAFCLILAAVGLTIGANQIGWVAVFVGCGFIAGFIYLGCRILRLYGD